MFLSQFKQTYMLIMEYSIIRGEDFLDYAKNSTWNLLHEYIDAHTQYRRWSTTHHKIETPMCKNELFLKE